MGKLIVLEGIDGSGKATQAKLLTQALMAQGKNVMQVEFPRYESPSSAPLRMYLAGELGEKPGDVNAYAASVLFAVDRFASFKTLWGDFYMSDGIVIADRYTTSNAVHQCAKLPQAQWDAYLDWLFTLEYEKIRIPSPDTVFYLEVEPEVSKALLAQRYHADETKKDIHERDAAFLQNSAEAARYCAQRLGWRRVHCTQNGMMRSVEEIHAEILRQVVE